MHCQQVRSEPRTATDPLPSGDVVGSGIGIGSEGEVSIIIETASAAIIPAIRNFLSTV